MIHTLYFSYVDVVNVGVRLQSEEQTDDVGNGQEGTHGVHQRPKNKHCTINEQQVQQNDDEWGLNVWFLDTVSTASDWITPLQEDLFH